MKRTEPTLIKWAVVRVFADRPWWVGLGAYGLYALMILIVFILIAAFGERFGVFSPDQSEIVYFGGIVTCWMVADKVIAWLFNVEPPKTPLDDD